MYFVKTPSIIQRLFPQYVWRKATSEKVIYLTFDDGPIPEITPWVVACLAEYNAKATFFCLGENACLHPDLLEELQKQGHRIGNHTYHHVDGWATQTDKYLQDVEQCQQVIASSLFRPPYGRMKHSQAKALRKDYQIVLWDVMCGDFDASISNEKCWQNILQNTKSGSILVLHDNIKSAEKLRFILPRILAHYSQKGYVFKAL